MGIGNCHLTSFAHDKSKRICVKVLLSTSTLIEGILYYEEAGGDFAEQNVEHGEEMCIAVPAIGFYYYIVVETHTLLLAGRDRQFVLFLPTNDAGSLGKTVKKRKTIAQRYDDDVSSCFIFEKQQVVITKREKRRLREQERTMMFEVGNKTL